MDNPSPYPVNVTAEYPERSSRLLAFCGLVFIIKGILLLPHIIVLYFLGIVALLAQLVGNVAIIVTGWYPQGAVRLSGRRLALDHAHQCLVPLHRGRVPAVPAAGVGQALP